MKTLLKILAALAAVVVVLLAAVALAIRIFFPPEKLKALAEQQADKALHRRLEIGSIGLSLVSGLRIDGLRLSESPDFSKGEFLRADSFVLTPDWSALLARKLVARRLELDGASVNVIKEKDGRFNFSDMTGDPAASAAASTPQPAPARKAKHAEAAAPAPASAAAAPAALAVSVGSLRLKSVALHYVDRKQGTKADLALDGVQLDGFRTDGPFTLALQAKADYAAGGQRYAVTLDAKGTVDLGGGVPAKLKADFSSIALSTLGKRFTASVKVEDAAAPKIAFNAESPELDEAFLKQLAGPSVPAGIAVPAAKLSAQAAFAPPRLDVSSLELESAGAKISGSASVADVGAKEPRFQLKFSSNKIPLASLADAAASLKSFELAGTAALALSASGTPTAPQASGNLSLDGVGAQYQGQKLEKLTGQIRFTQAFVDAPQLAGRLNGGDFTLKLSGANLQTAPAVNLSGRLSLLDLGALQKLAAASPSPAPASRSQAAQSARSAPGSPRQRTAQSPASTPVLKTSGDFTVDKTVHPNFECGKMTVSWNLTGVGPDTRRLNGSAKVNVGPGQATDLLGFAAQSGGVVKALVVPLQALDKARALHIPGFNPPDLQNIPFTRIVGDYTMANGVVTMHPSELDGPSLSVSANGTVDLPAQTVNLKAMTTSSLGQLELAVTGPLSSPSVKPNLAQAAQSTAKRLLQDPKTKSFLQNQGKNLLKGLFH